MTKIIIYKLLQSHQFVRIACALEVFILNDNDDDHHHHLCCLLHFPRFHDQEHNQ